MQNMKYPARKMGNNQVWNVRWWNNRRHAGGRYLQVSAHKASSTNRRNENKGELMTKYLDRIKCLKKNKLYG